MAACRCTSLVGGTAVLMHWGLPLCRCLSSCQVGVVCLVARTVEHGIGAAWSERSGSQLAWLARKFRCCLLAWPVIGAVSVKTQVELLVLSSLWKWPTSRKLTSKLEEVSCCLFTRTLGATKHCILFNCELLNFGVVINLLTPPVEWLMACQVTCNM